MADVSQAAQVDMGFRAGSQLWEQCRRGVPLLADR